jgi:hypothetical protein
MNLHSETWWTNLQKTVCATFLLLSAVSVRADFYVAPAGSDQNDGSESKPFSTLERARDAVRELKRGGLPAGGITVWLRRGDYVRTNALEFTGADSGTAEAPILGKRIARNAPG